MPDPENFIRISYDDANSEHVETLLRRQMSLRGERGITNVRPRRWFYQSWFILMLAGGLFAFAAWALIEPHFDDMINFQGPITDMKLDGQSPTWNDQDGHPMHLKATSFGSIEVAGQHVWVLDHTKLWVHKKAQTLKRTDLKKGDEVRVYVEPVVGANESILIAEFVETSPPPMSESRASMSL